MTITIKIKGIMQMKINRQSNLKVDLNEDAVSIAFYDILNFWHHIIYAIFILRKVRFWNIIICLLFLLEIDRLKE